MGHQFDPKDLDIRSPEFSVRSMGKCAQQTLAKEGISTILGVTSKGVFLQNQEGQVFFITGEVFHGPITINLHRMLDFRESFPIGEKVRILKDRLVCSRCQILFTGDIPIWSHSTIKFSKEMLSPAILRGTDLVKHVLLGYEQGLFHRFLNELTMGLGTMNREHIWDLLPGQKNEGDFFQRLKSLIGLGRGLTPAGDDFICGFLLAWYSLQRIDISFNKFNSLCEVIIAEAQKKTTALSATLIYCASQGDADERLHVALSWIAQGKMDISKVYKALLSYGSSSGVDALAGMLAAILLQ